MLCSFFFWSLHCQVFFDLRLLNTPFVSSNISLKCYNTFRCPLQHKIKPRHDITEVLFKVALNTKTNIKSNVLPLPLYLPMTFKLKEHIGRITLHLDYSHVKNSRIPLAVHYNCPLALLYVMFGILLTCGKYLCKGVPYTTGR